VTPPIRKLKIQARQNSIGTSKRVRPCQSVPSADRTMNPVGSEITSVESM